MPYCLKSFDWELLIFLGILPMKILWRLGWRWIPLNRACICFCQAPGGTMNSRPFKNKFPAWSSFLCHPRGRVFSHSASSFSSAKAARQFSCSLGQQGAWLLYFYWGQNFVRGQRKELCPDRSFLEAPTLRAVHGSVTEKPSSHLATRCLAYHTLVLQY